MARPVMPRPLQLALFAACGVIVIGGMRAARPVLTPLALALFIAIVSLPALGWLRRHGAPTVVAILSIVLLDSLILSFFGWIVLRSLAELRAALPGYLARLQEIELAAVARLQEWGVEVVPGVYGEQVQPERLLDLAATAARNVSAVLAVALLVMLFLVFILAESAGLPQKLQRTFGSRAGNVARYAVILREVQHYLALKTLISLVTGTMVGVGAAVIGVDFALLWGFLAFVLNFIPTVGSIVAAIPAVLLALLQLGPGPALALAVVYLSVNVGIGNFADPILLGRQLRLSTLVVLLSLVFWGWVWGGIGMFLAVPLTISVRIALENSESFRVVAALMGPAGGTAVGAGSSTLRTTGPHAAVRPTPTQVAELPDR